MAVEIWCHVCGRGLCPELTEGEGGRLEITPCPTCMSAPWLVLCGDGERHVSLPSRPEAEEWLQRVEKSWRDDCGPHRIAFAGGTK